MSILPLRRFLDTLFARYHLWIGRRAYRAGHIRTAGRHLGLVVARRGDSFDAHLLLGKIAYRERDLGRAAQHFHRARSADPARFSLEGFPDDFVRSLQGRPATTPRVRYRIVIEAQQRQAARRDGHPAETAQPARQRRRRRTLGDFTSHSEWLKYRDLPAFRPGEGADVDWDAEARKLFDD